MTGGATCLLPLPVGRGWGEGAVLAPGVQRQKNSLSLLSPAASLKRGVNESRPPTPKKSVVRPYFTAATRPRLTTNGHVPSEAGAPGHFSHPRYGQNTPARILEATTICSQPAILIMDEMGKPGEGTRPTR